MPDGQAPEGVPRKQNRGWFKPSDGRINRLGRPLGRRPSAQEGFSPGELAPRSDRLMLLCIPARDLAWRLSRYKAPWIVNLPADFEIVASRVDAVGNVALVVRSKAFPRIAKGTDRKSVV